MEAERLQDLIEIFTSTATISNLTSNENDDVVCYIKETDEGRYRVKAKLGQDPTDSLSFTVLSEDLIPIDRPYRSTDKLYQISKGGVEVFKDIDGRLVQIQRDGTLCIISELVIDHFSFIEPVDSIVAVVDERVIVRIELDGRVEPLFDERDVAIADYFIADPVASKDRDLVVFRFWSDNTMPFYESNLRAIELSSANEVALDLYPSPIYSQPQFGVSGRYFSYIAVVEDNLKIVVHEGDRRIVVSPEALDQGDYDYGFGQRTYCFNDGEEAIYCQNYSDGFSTLIRIDLQTLETTDLEYGHFELPTAIHHGVAAIRSGAKTPTNITAVRTSRTNDGHLSSNKRLLFSSYPKVDRTKLKEPETFFATSGDSQGEDLAINGHLYRAENEQGLMVMVHGGPIGAAKVNWNAKIPLLNQLGISVATFNQRGSSGYGHKFMLALNRKYALADVEDTLAVIEYVKENSNADSPIFIYGGSAAGVVAVGTAAKLVTYDDSKDDAEKSTSSHVAGLILNYPVVDIPYVHNNTHRFEKSLFGYLIGEYPLFIDEYVRRSPAHLEVDIPTLIMHGNKDKVVPIESVIDYANARPNVVVEVMEGYGHGFSDPEGQRRELSFVTRFVQEHLN